MNVIRDYDYSVGKHDDFFFQVSPNFSNGKQTAKSSFLLYILFALYQMFSFIELISLFKLIPFPF